MKYASFFIASHSLSQPISKYHDWGPAWHHLNHLRPEEEFRLYAISTRYPANLDKLLTKTQAGVYEIEFCHPIRVLILNQFPETPNNAFWQLFSANAKKVFFGQQNYQWRRPNLSSVIDDLFKHYHLEGIMSYTVEDYVKNYRRNFLESLSVEEKLAGLSPEQRLQGPSPDEVEAYLGKLKSQAVH